MGDDVYNATLAASLLTILINAVLMRIVPTWASTAQLAREAPRADRDAPAARTATGTWCCADSGGWAAPSARPWRRSGFPTRSSRCDPDVVKHLRRAGRGVPLRRRRPRAGSWRRRGRARAALAVVTVPEIERARLASSVASGPSTPALPILARAHHGPAHEELRARAAPPQVVQPELEAAATLIRHALNRLSMPTPPIVAYLERFRDAIDLRAARETTVRHPLPEIREVAIGSGRARRSVAAARPACASASASPSCRRHAWRRLRGDRSRRGDDPARRAIASAPLACRPTSTPSLAAVQPRSGARAASRSASEIEGRARGTTSAGGLGGPFEAAHLTRPTTAAGGSACSATHEHREGHREVHVPLIDVWPSTRPPASPRSGSGTPGPAS